MSFLRELLNFESKQKITVCWRLEGTENALHTTYYQTFKYKYNLVRSVYWSAYFQKVTAYYLLPDLQRQI